MNSHVSLYISVSQVPHHSRLAMPLSGSMDETVGNWTDPLENKGEATLDRDISENLMYTVHNEDIDVKHEDFEYDYANCVIDSNLCRSEDSVEIDPHQPSEFVGTGNSRQFKELHWRILS